MLAYESEKCKKLTDVFERVRKQRVLSAFCAKIAPSSADFTRERSCGKQSWLGLPEMYDTAVVVGASHAYSDGRTGVGRERDLPSQFLPHHIGDGKSLSDFLFVIFVTGKSSSGQSENNVI